MSTETAPATQAPSPPTPAAPMDRAAFERILTFGVERGISDLHFEVSHPPHLLSVWGQD